ncbi:unknown protein [Parachlamydia acanthamoebae UV-7]|uniref:Zeta toxin domain-containing protein n=2 Tax=Parachlamydia acanthamoebae TaxID=83552 RepID=F8KW91_PARAV|nr:zeta toxin family protein [Parachlamydia acanthamoebae]KIA78323.1 hypothetical protein DB43_EF00050 [Parachlamydia acanthamoebae]CCB85918.1 unknown protein [Parachlamydia acanthamoebae UV-7]
MLGSFSFDACDLNLIYPTETGYEYSLPKNILESFLSGKAFDHSEEYSKEESRNLRDDINALYQKILSENPENESLAIITAGSPGAGKTTKLRQDLEEKRTLGKNYAYICPDDVCLQSQTKTYLADIETCDKSFSSRQKVYNKWRPGSNAAAHLILANLIREKYAFYFGTTCSSPATGKFFEFLKKQGYKIKIMHISASDDVRWGSINEREREFVQTTENDVKEKGLLVPQRIQDTFLKYADEIDFYYRDSVKENALLGARWFRNESESEKVGTLHIDIVNSSAYEKIRVIHNEAIKILEKPDLSWEKSVENLSKLITF